MFDKLFTVLTILIGVLGFSLVPAVVPPIPVISLSPSPEPKTILQTVPFAAQAPFGEWSDPRQQDGCEEAASLMAVKWARGEGLTLNGAKNEILKISAWEEDRYGSYHDTSALDTNKRILKNYFGYEKGRVIPNITIEDIKQELWKGNLVIVPTNGRGLGNPNFTAPGPERHMLVVIGYDTGTREFITNDNGTRQGKGYKYKEQVLFEAIRDYPTGFHEPIVGVKKAMIVVEKE